MSETQPDLTPAAAPIGAGPLAVELPAASAAPSPAGSLDAEEVLPEKKRDCDRGQKEGRAGRRKSSRGRYLHPLAHYAASLGYSSPKTLAAWIHLGDELSPPDPPPLDRPADLCAWWRRVMTYDPPDKLLELERAGADAVPAAEVSASPTRKGAGRQETRAPIPPAAEIEEMMMNADELDIDVSIAVGDMGLAQARSVAAALYKQMKSSLEAKNSKAYKAARVEWVQAIGVLRAWEKDILKIQEGRGEVLRARELTAELARIFTCINQSFTSALERLAELLAPSLPRAERRRIITPLRDKCFTHLVGSRFESAWIDAAAVLSP